MELIRSIANKVNATKWAIVSFCILFFFFGLMGMVMPGVFTKLLKSVRQEFHFIQFSSSAFECVEKKKKCKFCGNDFNLFHLSKQQINLTPKSDVRPLYEKVPFFIDFRIYMFNCTNPQEVTKGIVMDILQIMKKKTKTIISKNCFCDSICIGSDAQDFT